MPKMTFIEKNGAPLEVEAPNGLSVMEISHKHGIDIEGACGGCLACATCHVVVHPDWYGKLAEKKDEEDDMLDLALPQENLAPRLPDFDERQAGWPDRRLARHEGSVGRVTVVSF